MVALMKGQGSNVCYGMNTLLAPQNASSVSLTREKISIILRLWLESRKKNLTESPLCVDRKRRQNFDQGFRMLPEFLGKQSSHVTTAVHQLKGGLKWGIRLAKHSGECMSVWKTWSAFLLWHSNMQSQLLIRLRIPNQNQSSHPEFVDVNCIPEEVQPRSDSSVIHLKL